MAKTHKLSSEWNVTEGVLTLKIRATADEKPVGSFERKTNLVDVFGAGYTSLNESGQTALEFGAYTALRNATGSSDTLDEAETAVDRRLEAWADGEWGAEREQSAVPFSANTLIAKAVEAATNGAQSATDAATKLCALAEETCSANQLGAFASLEASDRAKIRKAVVDAIKKAKPVIAAQLTRLEAERDAAALARKSKAAAEALAKHGASGETFTGL